MKGALGISKHPSANTSRMVLGAYDRYVPEPKVNARATSTDRGRDQTQEQES